MTEDDIMTLTEDDLMTLACFAELFTRVAHAQEMFAYGDPGAAISTVARTVPKLWPRHVRALGALVKALYEREQLDETEEHTIQ